MSNHASASISLSPNQIHNVDCIAGMSEMPPGIVDLVFADPPFNIGFTYDVYEDSLDEDKYLAWSRDWMSGVHRVLKDDGAFWLAIGDEYAAELKLVAQQIGFTCRSWVIWYYTFGVHCKLKFTRSHAHLFHFVKHPKKFTFNVEAVRVPSARQLVYNDKRANSTGRMPDDTWILRPQDLVDGFTPDEDIWYFPRVAGTFKERAGFHGCQMPEQLIGRIVRACSNPGELVLDPFSGSATTVAVAKKLDRQFSAFELSQDYVELGGKRLAGIATGDPLDGSENPLASVPATAAGRKLGSGTKAPPNKDSVQHRTPKFSGFESGRLDFDKLGEFGEAIVTAFEKSNAGFSVDRVMADPVLAADFQTACDRIDVPGTAAERNRELFRLRKSGAIKFEGIATSQPTTFDWHPLSRCMFASEIAWRSLVDERPGQSLDEILADPRLASQFDAIAERFAPGFRPLEYRWAALSLRKKASAAKKHADDGLPLEDLAETVTVERLLEQPNLIPARPGVYVIRSATTFLYSGETIDLRERLATHFVNERVTAQWTSRGPSIEVLYASCETIDDHRLARQCILVRRYQPTFNMVDLFQ